MPNTQWYRLFLRGFNCLLINLFILSSSWGNEYLEPVESDRFLIDGSLEEWKHFRRHSAEYLLKGHIASLNDFSGGLRVAYNKEWVFFAIDGQDSQLVPGRQGDYIDLNIIGASAQHQLNLRFQLKQKKGTKKEQANQAQLFFNMNMLKPRAFKSEQISFKSVVENQRYGIEIKIPLQSIPWLYGASVSLTASFHDQDLNGDHSIYATHLSQDTKKIDQISYIFGGNQLYRNIYDQEVRTYKTYLELNHDWIGDGRDELLLITDSEVVLFGDQVKKGRGYVRYVHGWDDKSNIKASIKGQKEQSTLIIHLMKKKEKKTTTEQFQFKAGQWIKLEPTNQK